MYNRLFTIIAVTSGASAIRQQDMRSGEKLGLKIDNFGAKIGNGFKAIGNSIVGAINGVGSAIYGSTANVRYRSAIDFLPLATLQPKDMLVHLHQRRVDVAYFLEFADQDKSISREDLNIKIAEAELKSVDEMIALIEKSTEEEVKSLNGVNGAVRALSFYQWRRTKGWKDAFAFSADVATIAKDAVLDTIKNGKKYLNDAAAALVKSAKKGLKTAKRAALQNISTAAKNLAEGADAVAESTKQDDDDDE